MVPPARTPLVPRDLSGSGQDVERAGGVHKDAYALRSRCVHHGHKIDELGMVRAFMLDPWVLFLELAKASRRFDTEEQLIDYLEAMKLS